MSITTLNSIRACAAPRADGIVRCRLNAINGAYCTAHAECGKTAPAPDVILFKARVNPKWIERFEEAGVRWQVRNDAALQERHAQMAETEHRQPNAVREERADSGTPVFGKDGAKSVSVETVKDELLGAGYCITDIHLYRRPSDQQMATIEVVMSTKPTEYTPPQTETQETVWKLIEKTSWEAAHVWANGKNSAGMIVHTINLCHRLPDAKPECTLTFAGGLWDLV